MLIIFPPKRIVVLFYKISGGSLLFNACRYSGEVECNYNNSNQNAGWHNMNKIRKLCINEVIMFVVHL